MEEIHSPKIITFTTFYDPNLNPFVKNIEVCGCRACTKCARTKNENFGISDEPSVCSKCRGTGKETYFETKPNPYFDKTPDELDRIISQYRYKSQVGDICKYLNSKEELDGRTIKVWKECIESYEKLGGDNPLIQIAKTHIHKLSSVNDIKNYHSRVQLIQSKPSLHTQAIITKYKKEGKLLEQNNIVSLPIKKKYLDPSINLLGEIEASCMKKAIEIPVEALPFVKPPLSTNTFSHISDLSKPQGPILTVKPTKWNEWSTFEADNGGFIDIMSRHSAMWGQALAEQEKISWMRQFIVEYRKYATYCKSQGVKPDPIPNVGVLNRRLEYVTLEDGERIYNTHYDPPGCVIM